MLILIYKITHMRTQLPLPKNLFYNFWNYSLALQTPNSANTIHKTTTWHQVHKNTTRILRQCMNEIVNRWLNEWMKVNNRMKYIKHLKIRVIVTLWHSPPLQWNVSWHFLKKIQICISMLNYVLSTTSIYNISHEL